MPNNLISERITGDSPPEQCRGSRHKERAPDLPLAECRWLPALIHADRSPSQPLRIGERSSVIPKY